MPEARRLIDKIEEDFNHGGKLGTKSTQNVIHLLREMHNRIERLELTDKERRAARDELR